jgi:hypothetical protein
MKPERCVTGIYVDADSNGNIKPIVAQFKILKETDKLVYPDKSEATWEAKSTIRHLGQISKSFHCDSMQVEAYSNSFSVQLCSITETPEEISALIERAKERVRIEIEDRAEVSTKWFEAFRKMVM